MNKRPSVKLKAEMSMVSLNDCGKSGWDWFGKGLEEDLGWSICHLTKKKYILSASKVTGTALSTMDAKVKSTFCSQET